MERKELISTLASTAASGRRPILTLANGDNTWLISIPRPSGSGSGKAFYHILQDPWLVGTAQAISSWFLQLQHKQKEALGSVGAVEDLIEEMETAAGGSKNTQERWLDAIVITHLNTDHLHEETLRTADPATKMFAVADVVPLVSALNHFDAVTPLPDFVRGEAWPTTPEMPDWLSVFRLPDESNEYPLLWHAMAIRFKVDDQKDEMVLYSPHGVRPPILEAAREVNADVNVLAMLHPLNICGISTAKSLGVPNGLKVERLTEPKYWIGTHDDKIQYSGFLGYFMAHGRMTLEDGLAAETKEKGEELRRPNFIEVGNGASYILA